MLRRVLARAIPLSSASSTGLPALLNGASRVATSSGDHSIDGGEDDPFSFPDHHQQQLPPDVARGVDAVVAAAEANASNTADAVRALDRCGAEASEPLVVTALARLRNSCGAAHVAFRWAAAQPRYAPGRRASQSMLAKHRRFDDARALLDEMRHASTASPLGTTSPRGAGAVVLRAPELWVQPER